jgi:hypothetical protein
MPFIGNTPDVNFTSFAKQDLTGVTGSPAKRGYTLSHAVANANEIEVFVNNVRQEPTEAYTVSGTGLTMTGDVETSDDFYIIFLGKAIQTTVPPDGSVGTAKIVDSAVSTAKIADDAVNLTSKVTGVLPYANGGNQTASMCAYTWTSELDPNNSNTTIPATSIMVNIGSDLASSGVYTCPVNGVYRATIWGMAGGDGSNSDATKFTGYLSLNDAYPSDTQYQIYMNPATTYLNFSANFLITCSATNTLRWGVKANRRNLHAGHGQATFKLEHQT